MDLVTPLSADVDFGVDVAEALARIPRFTGHVRSGPYSVAQHSILGADLLYKQHKEAALAAAFLLHDAHEAYMGDIATPVGQALAEHAARAHMTHQDPAHQDHPKVSGSAVQFFTTAGHQRLKRVLDTAIHSAAGLPFPLPKATADLVKAMDMALLQVERQQLLGPPPHPWPPHPWANAIEQVKPAPLKGRIRVWTWPEAADEFRERLRFYLPQLRWRAEPRARRPTPRLFKPRSRSTPSLSGAFTR
jgi:hypothetical protein